MMKIKLLYPTGTHCYTLILALIVLGSPLVLLGQEDGQNEDVYDLQQRTNTTLAAFLFTMDEGAANVQGEPFLHEEWLEGRLFFVDDTVNVQMRYHVLQEQLIFIHPYFRKKYVAKPDQVYGFSWNYQERAQEFVRLETRFPKIGQTGYAEVLRKERFWILKQYRKRIAKADHKDPFGTSRNFDKIIEQPEALFVLDTQNDQLIRWNGSRNDWKQLAGKKGRDAVLDHAEARQLDPKSEKDLPELLRFLEESH